MELESLAVPGQRSPGDRATWFEDILSSCQGPARKSTSSTSLAVAWMATRSSTGEGDNRPCPIFRRTVSYKGSGRSNADRRDGRPVS